MPFGLKTTVAGVSVSPNLGLAQATSDAADAAAMQFGNELLCRIDPRDVLRPADNPTGAKRVHSMAPNRDPLVFMTTTGGTIGPVSGKYDGKDVFVLTDAATNTLNLHANSLGTLQGFSMVGAAHYESAMLGSGFHALLAFKTAAGALDSCIAHQFSGGTDFLTGFADQGDGGGANYTITGGTRLTAGTPFVFVWTVLATGGNRLFVNTDLDTSILATLGSNTADAVARTLSLGFGTSVSQQWVGALGRTYMFSGDILSTADKKARARALVLELMTHYGIA